MASSRRRLSTFVVGLLAAALALVSASALAQPTAQQKELARDLMQKGHDARNAHDLKVALESFKGADAIMHVPTTGFEVARSQVDLGMLVEAHETLLAVMRSPERPDEPPAFRDARGYAKVLDDELVPRIPVLRIQIQGARAPEGQAGPAPAVAVDGVTLPQGALLVPYKVDPGHHVVTAKTDAAAGKEETDVAERQSKDVTVTLAPIPVAATPAAVPTADEAGVPTGEVEARAPSGGGLGAVTWAGLGVAAAGVVAGTVTGIMTLSDKGSIASQCNGNRCPPSTYDSLSTANTLATTSTVAFAVAGGGAVVAVVSWLLRAGDAAPTQPAAGAARSNDAHVAATPALGVGYVGLTGVF
jgi:hypothetical protein